MSRLSQESQLLQRLEYAKKVFISGPMTGIEKYNFPKFLAMEEAIRKMGWKPVNLVHK